MADNATTESSAASESSAATTDYPEVYAKQKSKEDLKKIDKYFSLYLTEEKSHYRERIKNYTIDADAKPTPSEVEAAAARIKDLKTKIKTGEAHIRILKIKIREAEKDGDEKEAMNILDYRISLKGYIIHLYRQLGDLVRAYNSKYSIAAQLAQTATAATEIAEALTA